MLTFNVNEYTITVNDATSHALNNLSGFDAVYLNDDGYKPTSMQAIHLHSDGVPLKSILLGATGGGTGVYDNTALIDNDRLVTCCSDTVFCLSTTRLDLLWQTKVDMATCFAVYQYQQDYIVHGELEISRLDSRGNIVWQNSGADIFVTPHGDSNLILLEDGIVATDFKFSKYVFDYDGNAISYTTVNSESTSMLRPLSPLTYQVVAYRSVPDYNMDECVDWAMEMVKLGYDTENLLILAGLSKPVNYFETVTYLEAAVREIRLKLKAGDEGVISYSSYYIMQIAHGIDIRENLRKISVYYADTDHHESIESFDQLRWAWDDMDWNDGQQWYWPGATLDNIEKIVIDTAKQWLVNNEPIYSQGLDTHTHEVTAKPQITEEDVSLIDAIKMTLRHYPELVIENQEAYELVIRTNIENGFAIGLVTSDREYTLYFDDYHMHYDIGDEEEILQLIVHALTGMLRLEVYSKYGHDYKWILQQKDTNQDWQNKGTTAILNLRFWIKPETRYLQNDSIFIS
ncbi:hypothetical protein KHS38_15215 [Mucilaginibacter sp. Bleaf8]|uniref:hypothetical protein n=1 Tax=Mucilaginibacter sp. Bleaf8 TaxID=2834430 RepID=UPI001BCF2AE4|nr:hypothetical protein [Mucilaginibacter sp. Bleaf8]MBS7565757.1 hypothetical protein [Mucilaginibacter sp. Bleaf8]